MPTKIHPKEFGFVHGMDIKVNARGDVVPRLLDENFRLWKDVVYVSLIKGRGLECLKVGMTGGSALNRWKGVMRVFDRQLGVRKLKLNEERDAEKMLEHCLGKTIEVWFKKAARAKLPYFNAEVSMRIGEEEFLDSYYSPAYRPQRNSKLRVISAEAVALTD